MAKDKRFVMVLDEEVKGAAVYLFVDSKTGVQYLELDQGVTVLVDRDGKPLLHDDF